MAAPFMDRTPLVAQRLLVAGLLGMMALGGVALWLLGSREQRALRTHARANEPGEARTSDAVPAVQSAAAGPPSAERERAALSDPLATAADARADEGFDPEAVYGRVLHAGQPVADVELYLFLGPLERREHDAPVAQTRSDAGGRFRW